MVTGASVAAASVFPGHASPSGRSSSKKWRNFTVSSAVCAAYHDGSGFSETGNEILAVVKYFYTRRYSLLNDIQLWHALPGTLKALNTI